MNCATHSESEATAFCRSCGRALCAVCIQDQQGVPYCEVCRAKDGGAQAAFEAGARWRRENPERDSAARTLTASSSAGHASRGYAAGRMQPAARPADPPSPFLALILGLIPGVGAVYNGHYAKAVFHVVVFGGIITLIGSGTLQGVEPLFVMLAIMFFLYMPIESCRTARAIRRGEQVDEFAGLLSLVFPGSHSPVAGIVLIGVGIVFLLQSLGYWRIRNLLPYWPVSLIALGIYMLYRRLSSASWHEDGGDASRRFGHGAAPSNLGLRESNTETRTDSALPADTDADDSLAEPEPAEPVRRSNA